MKITDKYKSGIGYIILISTPFLLLVILSIITQKNHFIGVPVFSDEMDYWRCVLSFLKHGWNTGYYGINDLHPKYGTFSTHGFFPTLFYYPYALLFGWDYNAIVIANSLFVTLCFIILVVLIKPKLTLSISISFIYLSFLPVILHAGTSMTDIINYGLISLFFTFFYKFYNLNSDLNKITDRNRKIYLYLTIFVATASSFYRLTYIFLLLFPVFVLSQFKFSKKLIILLISWLCYSGLIYLINSLFISPYPIGVLFSVMNSGDLVISIKIIIQNISSNLKRFFTLVPGGDYTDLLNRYLYVLMMFVYLFLSIFQIEIAKSNEHFISIKFRRENYEKFYILLFIMLFLPLFTIIVLYDVAYYRDYRTLAPLIWASYFILIIFNRKKILHFSVIIMIFFMMLNINTFAGTYHYQVIHDRYTLNCDRDFSQIYQLVVYNPNATDPYENTLISDLFDFCLYAQLHPGIGIEYVTSTDNINSKYMLLHFVSYFEGYELVLDSSYGYLYIKV